MLIKLNLLVPTKTGLKKTKIVELQITTFILASLTTLVYICSNTSSYYSKSLICLYI